MHGGVHCIILVARYGRWSASERANVKALKMILDEQWYKSCMLVLTHYDGETDNDSKTKCINDWKGNDRFVLKLLDKIDNRIILTDNSTGRHEEANRPLRMECLNSLKEFINSCQTFIGSKPIIFIEKLKQLIELYFKKFKLANAAIRIENSKKYLMSHSQEVYAAECSICLQEVALMNLAQTECLHCFHLECIQNSAQITGYFCPICRSPIKKLVVTMHLQLDF